MPIDWDETDSLILVDVDGVLNVGIKEPGTQSLLLNDTNVAVAHKMLDMSRRLSASLSEHKVSVLKLAELMKRPLAPGNGKGATYKDLVAASPSAISDVLVRNLAKIVDSAGKRCGVVLSSTWRKPQYLARVRTLESALSTHLGRPFTFDDCTPLIEERDAGDRLKTIRTYLKAALANRVDNPRRLRVLVLDDFSITPCEDWYCMGYAIKSASDVEKFLSQATGGVAMVKLLHTYDTWTGANGLSMQVGCGLQQCHVDEARQFFELAAVTCTVPEEKFLLVSSLLEGRLRGLNATWGIVPLEKIAAEVRMRKLAGLCVGEAGGAGQKPQIGEYIEV